jgi:hypothetical protein
MDKALKEKWTTTLEAGTFEQTKSWLRDKDNRCCCLGVLCDISGLGRWTRNENRYSYDHGDNSFQGMPTDEMLEAVGLTRDQVENLINFNDCENWDFKRIAKWIKINVGTKS